MLNTGFVARTNAPPHPAPRASGERWFVYIARCNDGSLYTGIARDVALRIAAHNAGRGARYTRGLAQSLDSERAARASLPRASSNAQTHRHRLDPHRR